MYLGILSSVPRLEINLEEEQSNVVTIGRQVGYFRI